MLQEVISLTEKDIIAVMKQVKELAATDLEQIGLQRLVYGLSPLVSYLDEMEVSSERLFETSGIDPQSLNKPRAMMSLLQEQTFIHEAIEAVDTDGLGLLIGSRFKLSAYGILGLAIMSSKNLQEGLLTIIDLQCLTWSKLCWRLIVDNDQAIIEGVEMEPLGHCMGFILERDFVCTVTACNEMLDLVLPLKEVRFSHAKPTYAQDYLSAFQCPVKFDEGKNQLIFDARWLEEPLPRANKAVHAVSYHQCQEQITPLLELNTHTQAVEQLIASDIRNTPSIDEVSSELHLTPRTLRRRLAQEGTNFQSIIMRLRAKLATNLLLNSKLTVSQIAENLGYSDAASFGHAFKRWTGTHPSALRKG